MTSLRRLEHISKNMSIPDITWTSQKHLPQVFVGSQKYPTKTISCDFHKVITISDKIDRGPLETLKKCFWEQCVDISQVCHEYQWADICVRVLASQQSSKPNSRCIIYYFRDLFWLIKLCITMVSPIVTMNCAEIQKSSEVK